MFLRAQHIADISDILGSSKYYLFEVYISEISAIFEVPHSPCFLYHRLYSSFPDFAYPELIAPSKNSYSDVEGWDRNLKIYVPFVATVTTVVDNKLVEVLKKDAKRFIFFPFHWPIFVCICKGATALQFCSRT